MSDEAALLANYAARGDASAFATLVQRHGAMVYGVARRITRSAHDAEDVAQDCFLELARRAATISGSVGAWLHATTVNRSLNHLRSAHARRRREGAPITVDPAVEEADDDVPQRVNEELARLPERQRVAIILHVLEGRSQADVAAELDVDQSTVSRAIDVGIATIRSRLAGPDVSDVAALAAIAAAPGVPTATALRGWAAIGISGLGSAPPAVVGASAVVKFALIAFALLVGACVAMFAIRSRRAEPAPAAVAVAPSPVRGLGLTPTDAGVQDLAEALELRLWKFALVVDPGAAFAVDLVIGRRNAAGTFDETPLGVSAAQKDQMGTGVIVSLRPDGTLRLSTSGVIRQERIDDPDRYTVTFPRGSVFNGRTVLIARFIDPAVGGPGDDGQNIDEYVGLGIRSPMPGDRDPFAKPAPADHGF